MKIAVYTGSFNPLHVGHLAVMRFLTETMDFDMVYLIVSPRNPFKREGLEASGRARYEAALEAVARHPELRVRVDDIELGMPAPQYTIRTLDALAEREPGNSFTLIIGADNLAGIARWREGPRILTDYGVAVYPREGFDAAALRDTLMAQCPDYRIELFDAPKVDVSSTQIREALAAGRDVSSLLM
ncbi:MAG: nicotinate (nicotinamide) nucleotide adenylyltransferase [Bacteroidales bacterium]|nr:nicotinate (nicotinamide) nucleotide adenylyltransferase [Bacteroidales bacterium]